MSTEFHLTLIKPSRYDTDGYVIQWRKTAFPSHALCVLNALALDCDRRRVLGPAVRIRVAARDDQCGLPDVKEMVRWQRRKGSPGLVGLVGIQSTQFPRAADLARQFRAAGLAVVMGGIHVSAAYAMEPVPPPELQEMLDLGVSLFAGEAEEHVETLLKDAHAGQLKPVYNFIRTPADLTRSLPEPVMPDAVSKHLATPFNYTPVETGRGCPFNCSFCTIINVYGRRMRSRPARAVADLVRSYVKQGQSNFIFTDDNFARSPKWREILEALIRMREEEGLAFTFMLQSDTRSGHDPDFIPMAVRAGCSQVFVGLENINPDALASVNKTHNAVETYQPFFLEWKRHGVRTMAGYILGFPNDTPAGIRRDIDYTKHHLAVDLIYFFLLTPLPGSADYLRLKQAGVPLDPDLARYSTYQAVCPHPRMTGAELEAIFEEAWTLFYDDAHLVRILARHMALGNDPERLAPHLLAAAKAFAVEQIHPFESGFSRIKDRRHRRPGFPREPVLAFYWRRTRETLFSRARWLWHWHRMSRFVRRARNDAPGREIANDPALCPPEL